MADPLECTVCGTRFPGRDELVDHVVDAHAGLVDRRIEADPAQRSVADLRRALKEYEDVWAGSDDGRAGATAAAAIDRALDRLREDEG